MGSEINAVICSLFYFTDTTMNNQELPPYFDNDFQSIYGNFGARFAALLLDGLIMSPMTVGFMIWNAMDLYSFYYTFPVTLVVCLFYFIYLPVSFGATPGKRLMGLTIVKSTGHKITYKDAFMRYLPPFLLSLIAISCNLVAMHFADPEVYNAASWTEKTEYLTHLNPRMYYSQVSLTYLYFFSNLMLFLVNQRKRSIADFSGDTVVVYDRFMKKISGFINSSATE